MSTPVTHLVLQEEAFVCTAADLSALSGLSVAEVLLLAEHGLIPPLAAGSQADGSSAKADRPAPAPPDMTPAARVPSIRLQYVVVATTARRLRDDFELDGDGWLLAVRLWTRLQETEGELRRARAQLSRFLGG